MCECISVWQETDFDVAVNSRRGRWSYTSTLFNPVTTGFMHLDDSEKQLSVQEPSTQKLDVRVRPFFWFGSKITRKACSGFSWPESELRPTPDHVCALFVCNCIHHGPVSVRWNITGTVSVLTEYRRIWDVLLPAAPMWTPVSLHPFRLRLHRRRHNIKPLAISPTAIYAAVNTSHCCAGKNTSSL